jgi:3-methyladenine DNA glycosylase AlkD
VLQTIRRGIDALADPARAERVRVVVPGARTNGAPVPGLRALAKRVGGPAGLDSFSTACRLMDALCQSGSREDMLVGTFLVGRHQKFVKTLAWSRVRKWLRAVDNWETCDQLAAAVLASMVHARPALLKQLLALTRSPDRWQRRLAVATAASVNQRGRSQPAITRAICARLENDTDRMIRQAVAWANRELEKGLRRDR